MCRATKMIAAAVLAMGWGISSASASRVTVGGIYLTADLLDASNSDLFRSYPNTGVYLHNGGVISSVDYGWESLTVSQRFALVALWGGNGPESVELGFSTSPTAWSNLYAGSYVPVGVQGGDISVNVPTEDSGNHASLTDALATLPASNITDWKNYVDSVRSLSPGGVTSVYPVYAPNTNATDPNGNKVQAWLMGGPGANPFASGAFFADVREMAVYGGGITVDTPPKQFFGNIPAGTDGQGQAEYQAIAMGEVAWANANNLKSIWIVSPNTAAANYNALTQQMVRTLETNATGSLQYVPSEYAVENYGTTTAIKTNNAIGSEDQPNTEMGVALWLAGYEQGRTGDLQLNVAGKGATQLHVASQAANSLGGKDTTVALSGAGVQASSYTITLQNMSSNNSNWYIPTLLGMQTGGSADWSVQILLNGRDITSYVLSDGGFTFNATASVANAGLVMNPGVAQTLTVNFNPLDAGAAVDPYSFELTGLAHPGASDSFASVAFVVVPEPGLLAIVGLGMMVSRVRFTRWQNRSEAKH